MPGFPFPGRPGGEHDEPLLDMIIARRALPPDAPEPMHDLARMLAALAGQAEPGELAGEAAVRAAFNRAASPAGISSAARRLRAAPADPTGPKASWFPGQAGDGAARGGGWAGQRPGGLHGRPAQPHSATGARHGGGAGPAQIWPPPRGQGQRTAGRVHAPAQQPARIRTAPLGGRDSAPQPGTIPEAELQTRSDQVARSSFHRDGLQPDPAALAQSAAEVGGVPEAALVVPGGELHRHPERAGGRAHAEPVRSLTGLRRVWRARARAGCGSRVRRCRAARPLRQYPGADR